MSNWECGVCGYLHKEGEPPEKCPICEAPQKMFIDKSSEQEIKEPADPPTEPPPESGGEAVEKTWRCTVSGYLHEGIAPPEKCPVCEATAEQFEEVIVGEEESAGEPDVRRWRCTVCGYIHGGNEPPEKCPVCAAPAVMFVEIDTAGKDLTKPHEDEIEPLAITADEETVEASPTFLDKIGSLILKLHLHPITVHFPNGILPAAVAFLALAVFLKIAFFEPVAYFNFVFVLIMLPVVLFTGYIEWQKRYKGLKTAVFITKILCGLIVLSAVNVLVFWRIIDPQVAAEGSPYQLIYFGVAAVALAAAGISGHLGGKLVFASRGT
jgi:rubrerythrin/uncharacterized membrane protein